jgi:hypothetical protein
VAHVDSLLDQALRDRPQSPLDASIISPGDSWIRLVFKIGNRLGRISTRAKKSCGSLGQVEIFDKFEAKPQSGFIGVRVSATGKREAIRKVVTMLSHYFL